MGNKILTLFDIEFRRIQKAFFTILGLLSFGNIMILTYNLYTYVKVIERDYNVSLGMRVLKTDVGRDVILNQNVPAIIYSLSNALMMMALVWCAFYCVRIWNRDFNGKSKSIYTLFMLPENKFIIFVSKLLTMIVLVYGVILAQHILWIGDALIINKLTNISISQILAGINMSNRSLVEIGVPPIYPIEFVVNYILGFVVIIIVLFTAVLISKSRKRCGGFLGVVYVISTWMIYSSQVVLNCEYSDKQLIATLGCYAFISILSLGASYMLLNKQVYA